MSEHVASDEETRCKICKIKIRGANAYTIRSSARCLNFDACAKRVAAREAKTSHSTPTSRTAEIRKLLERVQRIKACTGHRGTDPNRIAELGWYRNLLLGVEEGLKAALGKENLLESWLTKTEAMIPRTKS